MKRIIAVGVLVLGLLMGGVGSAMACGDTPGFCPNPPDWSVTR